MNRQKASGWDQSPICIQNHPGETGSTALRPMRAPAGAAVLASESARRKGLCPAFACLRAGHSAHPSCSWEQGQAVTAASDLVFPSLQNRHSLQSLLFRDSLFQTQKLTGSTTSPYVRKVRVVLAEKSWSTPSNRKARKAPDPVLDAAQLLGKVPCLVLTKSAMSLYDSRVIVEYLDTMSPVGKLIPSTGRDRLEVKIWEALADGVLDVGAGPSG